MPVYNAEPFLNESIRSVAEQSFGVLPATSFLTIV